MKVSKWYIAALTATGFLAVGLSSCSVSIPKGATAVKSFDSKKYLGKWYEIARLDFKFEKNMDNITAITQ